MSYREKLLPSPDLNGAKRGTGPWLKLAVIVVVLVAAALVLRKTVLSPEMPIVTVATVERGDVEETVTNTRAGTVKARRRASLSPQIGGRVVELPVSEGDSVEVGQLLLRLDDAIQQDRLSLATEDVRAASARSEEACLAALLAVKELTRQEGLHRQGIASEGAMDRAVSERDRGEAACRAAQAGTEQARARKALARTQLQQTRIVAPFDGVVAELSTELGEWITPSPPGLPIPPVVDLLNPHSLYISAPIDEMDAERVQIGQEVRISVDSRRGQSFAGRLVRVAPYVLDVVEQNRTVEIEAEFADLEAVGSLLPGTSADVEVIIERRGNVLKVPSTAVADGQRVLVVVDGVLEEREIVSGLGNWRMTEVAEGLSEGEIVVTLRRSAKLQPGVEVEIKETK
ncbi:MAG: efflux RND transporter periplasmic adaptor subunit [Acidobacteria bacterium]|nr:efflux RND transporter periplasmic adaptor subunit [Acidobacteriota bacterium]